MTDERFLITGALGCIGAWAVKRLVGEGLPVWTYDLPGDPHRLRLLMDDDALASVRLIQGDITDAAAFERAVVEHGITHVIHLAALQVPFVQADPVKGAQVNVTGTTIVFETAKRHAGQVQGLAYASSIGVYGAAGFPPGPLAHDAPLAPPTLYGVYKQANEGTARIYWRDHRLRSIGLRPYFVYGPGRDQGMSATPTKAMAAAAAGRPYRISFGGTAVYQHADDVAASFIQAARTPVDGAPVFNLGGTSASVAEIIAAIEAAAPEMAGEITYNPSPLPYPAEVDDRAVNATLGPLAWRPLTDGVRETIAHFRAAAQADRLDYDRAIG